RLKVRALPLETVAGDRGPQPLSQRRCLIERAIAHDQPELIASQPREYVACGSLALENTADLAQQMVAREMAAALVDDRELIEIDEQQCMRTRSVPPGCEKRCEAVLELPPVDETG